MIGPPVDERGVSPVIGVVLMFAIVVALAAVAGVMALGIDMPDDPAPQYSYRTNYVADGSGNTNDRPYVNLTLTGGEIVVGDEFYVTDSDGNQVRWDAIWTTSGPLTPGDYAHIDGYGSDSALNPACQGEVYRFVHDPEDDPRTILAEIRVDKPAVGPAATHC
jgi:flagellin-like protein